MLEWTTETESQPQLNSPTCSVRPLTFVKPDCIQMLLLLVRTRGQGCGLFHFWVQEAHDPEIIITLKAIAATSLLIDLILFLFATTASKVYKSSTWVLFGSHSSSIPMAIA